VPNKGTAGTIFITSRISVDILCTFQIRGKWNGIDI